jgi:hypothetical protein
MAAYIRTYKKQGRPSKTAHEFALCAYNSGPHRVKQYGGCPPFIETQDYYKGILANARARKAKRKQLVASAR